MSLGNEVKVSEDVKLTINNGFYAHHPFKNSSAQLEDYIKILNYVKALPEGEFHLCINVIEETANKAKFCPNCHGKGLVYLRLLCNGIDAELHEKFHQMYESFCYTNDGKRECESNMYKLLKKYKVTL